jgi:hypothetical protein
MTYAENVRRSFRTQALRCPVYGYFAGRNFVWFRVGENFWVYEYRDPSKSGLHARRLRSDPMPLERAAWREWAEYVKDGRAEVLRRMLEAISEGSTGTISGVTWKRVGASWWSRDGKPHTLNEALRAVGA